MEQTIKSIAILLMVLLLSIPVNAMAATTEITGGTDKESALEIEFSKEYGTYHDANYITTWYKIKTLDSPDYWYNLTFKNISIGHNGANGIVYDSFGETFISTSGRSGYSSTDGAKLEPNSTYYLAIWGDRPGTVKFYVDAVLDPHSDEKENATQLNLEEIKLSAIDSIGGLSEDRTPNETDADVDWFHFNTEEKTDFEFELKNIDIGYHNTYFEGVVAIIQDSLGMTVSYIEVRPDSFETVELKLNENTNYYVKVFSSSGDTGSYQIKLSEIAYYLLGDTDQNSKINIKDATLIQKNVAIISDISENGLIAADVNRDSKVNIKDATAIQKYLASIKIEHPIGEYVK